MVYVGMKHRESEAIGVRSFDHRLAEDASESAVIELIERLNADPEVSGVLVQLPLPDHLDGVKLTGLVDVGKDVDGLTALSAGLLALGRPGLRPCTPSGVMLLLESVGAAARGRRDGGHRALEPVRQADGAAAARRERDGDDVSLAHARPGGVCARADVLIAAVGRPKMVGADWVKPGAIVIDVGVNRLESGLVGDVDFEAGARTRRRDHAGAGGRGADDDRLPAPQHGARGARGGSGRVTPRGASPVIRQRGRCR